MASHRFKLFADYLQILLLDDDGATFEADCKGVTSISKTT